ncbi:isoprenyl transferase [Rhodoluna lacicola]|uniref:isoprenyl transferase n=1 Tax=Rhodoluna lacicola TaxID=529884 RepID=UPI002232A07F|nr:isoprenyl transferase [Rhodoluna lacicola]BDS50701.1 isoprenyl transferase [Rhodoluna lacicola]
MRNLIYRIYERSLERGLAPSDLPRHVAVMLDGNRRWAERRPGANAAHGHAAGANKIFDFLGWCDEIGIKVVTLYMLSTDNLAKRESKELADLLKIIGSVATEMAKRKRWKIRLVGDRASLPGELLAELESAETATAKLNKPEVNLAVGYGGRKEIADAMRSILKKHSDEGTTIEQLAELLDPDLITEHLYTGGQPDPDLIIRTSGEQRLSGFLLWQSSNSELYFEEALWPDFRKVDFLRAIRAFESRHRRFGA